jgi:integrase
MGTVVTGAWQKVWIIERSRRRGKSYQVVRWDAVAGRRVYVRSFRTERLASEYAQKVELHINGAGPEPVLYAPRPCDQQQAERTAEPPTGRPWADAWRAWLATRPVRIKTRTDYESRFRHFASQARIDQVEQVTPEIVSEFLQGIKAKGGADATTAGYLRVLRPFFRWARGVESPITPELLATWKPYRQHKRKRPHIYTPDEFERIMASCEQVGPASRARSESERDGLWWKTFITLLNDTGLRLGEAVHLIWQDVDFDAQELKIQPHVGLDGVLPWQPKGKAHRTVPLSPRLLELLAERQAAAPDKVPYVFLPASRYADVLRNGAGKTGEILHSVRKGFVKIRRRAAVLEGCIHDWRRTFITHWLLKMKPSEVQLLAGHEDIQTTLKIYGEVCDADVVAKAKAILHSTESASSNSSTVEAG